MRQPPREQTPPRHPSPPSPRSPPSPGLPGLTEFLAQAGPVLVPASPEPAPGLLQREATLGSEEGYLGLGRGEGVTEMALLPLSQDR